MKLAILGSSAIALEAALRFHAHEAAWTWFNDDELEIENYFKSSMVSWNDCTTELGRKLLKIPLDNVPFTWENWKARYYWPLSEYLKTEQSVKPYKVLSIAKRFLAREEEIPSKSRFYDLFRVIYQLNPEEFINQQKESNPETYQRLSEEFVESLQSSLEMYEDFDLIIDLRRATEPCSISVTGKAMGENRISKDHLYTGTRALQYAPGPDVREIALVGSDDMAAEVLVKLESWLKDPRTRLFVMSDEAEPFANYLKLAPDEIKEKIHSVLHYMDTEFQNDINDFHSKLREWQELDDFVQVKKQKPVEPIPRLVFFSGHNVTAIDQLIDKRRVFVTLEKPEWRPGLRQPENNHLDLKTIGVDEVIVATGLKKTSVSDLLRQDEIGFLSHVPVRPGYKNAWNEDLNALDSIEKQIFKLFSPVGAH